MHIHTTVSDGEKTPEETRDLYRANGYDFIAITDHNVYGIYPELNTADFLVFPGTEIDSVHNGKVHHVVGIGDPAGMRFDREKLRGAHPQVLVDELVHNNNIAIYAHPFWSYCEPELLLELRGITGMEIINYSCEQEWKSGISEFYYEYLLAHGRKVWCFGADDAHGHVPDYMGGYITVKAKEKTHSAILEAIREGSFYASFARAGEKVPEIFDFRVENGTAYIETSPCRNIHLNVSRTQYHPAHAAAGKTINAHEWKLPPDAKQVRAIVTDDRGHISWTQPITVNG